MPTQSTIQTDPNACTLCGQLPVNGMRDHWYMHGYYAGMMGAPRVAHADYSNDPLCRQAYDAGYRAGKERAASVRDYANEYDQACDEVCNRLADNLAEIDRRNGLEAWGYSVLRTPAVAYRAERVNEDVRN